MDRRRFIQQSIAGAAGAGLMMGLGSGQLLASGLLAPYDLVAVRGGEPGPMLDKAMQALGGMQAFVKKGQTVLIKPNIGWDVIPEKAANTNPHLVSRLVKLCFEAGAKKVVVFDNTCDTWTKAYANSGIEKAAKDAGAVMVPGNKESYYQKVDIPKAKKLKSAKVHELILSSDVFINVPVLKHHSSADLTLSMKNLMGVVWDRRWWHVNNLHQCIADFTSYRKPDLNVIDGYRVMMRNGPRGVSEADVTTMKALIVSTDPVAADAASAKLFGSDPASVDYIGMAEKLGLGRMDLEKLNIARLKM